MYLRYGSYTHALQEARVTITRHPLRDAAGVLYGYRERWLIEGRMVAADAGAISAALTELESAYSIGDLDLVLLLPDGVTESSHHLMSAACIGGTKIAQPVSYPLGAGAEYSTFRTYSVAIEGDVPLAPSQSPILAWQETLAFSGTGGPRIVAIECRNGPPQMQTVSQRTPVRVVQSGRAVGYRQYPAPPGPIWPALEQADLRRVHLTSPRTSGSGASRDLEHFEIIWSYSFLSPVALAGWPHSQP